MKNFSKIGASVSGIKSVLLAIVCIAVIVVGVYFLLPSIHVHTYSEAWTYDEGNHWHAAECEHKDVKNAIAAHEYDNGCDDTCNVCNAKRPSTSLKHTPASSLTSGENTHWNACANCGAKVNEVSHNFNKKVKETKYLKDEATASTKEQYWYSCVCGTASDEYFFEIDKKSSSITFTDAEGTPCKQFGKQYDKLAPTAPTYTTTNTEGAVTIEWYQGETKLDSAPINAGTYTVKVIIAESVTHTAVEGEAEFTISKRQITALPDVSKEYDGNAIFNLLLNKDNGLFEGDEISVTVTLAKKDAGSYNDAEIKGLEYTSENYEIIAETVNATITPKDLNVEGLTAVKEYDGNHMIKITFTEEMGLLDGEKISLNIVMESKEVGAQVSNSMFSVSGTKASNYTYGGLSADDYLLKMKAEAAIVEANN